MIGEYFFHTGPKYLSEAACPVWYDILTGISNYCSFLNGVP
jgi:hypothetical protein